MINPLLVGRLNRYRGIDAKDVAKAMNNAAKQPVGKLKFYDWKAMQELL